MPRVETYQEGQVQTQVTRGPRAGNAAPGSFGAPVAQGLSALAGSLQDRKNRLDNTAAEEAIVGFEREKNQMFFNPESGYFNTQGRDAFDQSGAMNESLEQLKRQYSEGLKSPQAKAAFDRVATAHLTRAQQDIDRHSSKHLRAWETATIESQVENTLENATLYWNDHERLNVQRALGRRAVFDASKLQGASPEVTQEKLQNYNSAFAKGTIIAAASSSAEEGKASLDKWGSHLEGPDLLGVNSIIDKKLIAEKTQQDSQAAVLTAGNLVGTFGDEPNARSLIIDEVNKIDDGDSRKQTMKESMFQLNAKQKADSETRGAVFEGAENHLIDGGSLEAFKSQNPEEWELLSPKQKRALTAGKPVITDHVLLSDLLTLPKQELANVDPPAHFHNLALADRGKLISAVKSAKEGRPDSQVGRSRTSQTTAAIEELLGKKADWGKVKQNQANTIYSVIDDEATFREQQKGGPLTSHEYTELLSGMTKQVVEEGFFNVSFAFGLGNTDTDLSDIPAADMRDITSSLHEQGISVTTDTVVIANFLRENGKAVTTSNVLSVLRQSK